jgi:hypothetical protein
MGAPQYEQAGADIGGTGTTNYIPRWTGPSTLGDSGITDNGTVIGVANGTRTLAFNLLQISGNTLTTSTAELALQYATSRDTTVYAPGSSIALIVKGTTGNVGIGTASPDVFSRGYGRVLGISGASSTAIGINAATGNVAYFDMGVNATRSLSLTTDGTTPSIAAIGALPLTFVTNSLERARIDSSGNVGIGTGAATTTPAATGSLVIGQNNVSQQWAARIYGGNDANRAPVLSLFRAGNTEGIIAEIKNGAVGALALGITGGVANFNDATLSAACQVQITSTLLDISGTNYGLKLPAAPGNADAQALDCYQETTLNSGFTTSGITSTGTFTVTARATRIGRGIAITIRVAPSIGASLTFASGWTITLTGVPQMPSEGSLAVATSDTAVGRGSVLISDAATPILYGGTVGAYALAANVPLTVSGFIA